ncbi:CBS domain-containing protein [Kutzneria kofuensis]|uniref:CBS domain-containing protein n=1 Tax=Kutzneria kofuensis TaxID=103725 RepID=A0A7W9KEA2_9PSEU|nr:CBS domain-containing protein [Kutzneria kofuensis]MBB5890598.1 CBS domain-containing protein [Kutzneria kofuensis]
MTDNNLSLRQQLLERRGASMALSELLALFDVRVRTYQTVSLIRDTLQEIGLATVPSFATCGLKANLLIVGEEEGVAEAVDEAGDGELAPGALPQQSFKIGDIPAASAGLISVTSSDPLTRATYLMRANNYSQVPVIDGQSDLRGVVTWSSVAARYETGLAPTLANAMVTDSLPVAEVHQELFAQLPLVAEHGYVLVRSNSGVVCGIVTAADIADRFHETALPFFLVGEIEFRLRKCLGELPPERIKAVQPNRPETQTGNIADLMFGDYVKLLDAHQQDRRLRENADGNWQALGWSGVDRTQFVHHLKEVKSTRNMIAHFDSKRLTPERITELRQFSGLLRQLM